MDFSIGSIIYWAFVGGLLGWIVAAFFRDGRFGLIGDIIIGAIGAIIGGIVLQSLLGAVGSTGALLATAIGALFALLIIRLVSSRADASGSPQIEPVQRAATLTATPPLQQADDATAEIVHDSTQTTVSEAATDAQQAVVDAVDSAPDAASDAASSAVDAAEDAVDSVSDTASDAADSVADAVSDAASSAVDAAVDAVDSVSDTASDAADSVTDAVSDAATSTVDAAEDAVDSVGSASSGNVSEAVANSNYPDDLTQVKGIGKVYQRGLFDSDIFTWDQIANSTPEYLKEVTEAIDAANPETWPSQAKQLAAENDRVGARYDGPLPDDLSKIGGLGKSAEHALKVGSIVTYQQLAEASDEQLGEILSSVRGKPDVGSWITQARKLAS